MYDLLLVDVIQSFADLSNDRTCVCLLHPVILSEQLQQLPASAILNQQVHILFVLEVAIERGDITMIEVELNTELSCDLIHILFLADLLL